MQPSKKEKLKKGKITKTPQVPIVHDYYFPPVRKVAITLEADSIEFMPVTDVNGTALVKSHADDSRFKGGESGIFIGSGEATDVDCGIKIEIAAGYKVNVESLVGSLLAVTSRIEENRLVVTLVNIGKDRVFLRYGSLVGRMVASPVYVFDYQGKP